MASCLRQVNATEMVNAEWDGIVYGIMGCPFTPVYDGVFFPDTPGKALQRKNFKKTSILLGTNRNEGHYFIIYYLTEIFKKEVTFRCVYSFDNPGDAYEEVTFRCVTHLTTLVMHTHTFGCLCSQTRL